MTFSDRLNDRIRATGSRVCLGIDPRPEEHPATHPDRFGGDPAQVAKAVVLYYQAIIEATHDLVACYKPQAAFFEALGIPGLIALAQLLAEIRSRGVPVILDAKRGDLGSTAEAYARAYLADGVFAADALTVNPYLGMDGVRPFVTQAAEAGRGVFVLVRTSNPGGGDFQLMRDASGVALFERVADRLGELAREALGAVGREGGYSPVGAVVGATLPAEEIGALRRRLPHSLLLLPGYGAQGGTADSAAQGFDADGLGAVVNASRSLTVFPDAGPAFAGEARRATQAMRDDLNEALERRG